MILGDSATRRVPDEFVTQRVNIANPPTLLLAVQSLMRRAGSLDAEERQTVLSFLSKAYPALHEWVQWFLHSQRGMGESFRWRGRSSSDQKVIPNTLASGLDDYPRAPLPHEHERHLDLHCWMVLACDVMTELGALLGEGTLAANTTAAAAAFDYAAKATTLRAALDEMHWSEQLQAYADVGVSGSKDQLRGEVLFRCGHPTDSTAAVDVSVPVEVVKSGAAFCPESHPKPLFPHGDGNGQVRVRERYVVQGELSLQYIPRLGYVNLFPLLLRVLDAQSSRLPALLALLETPSLLWSDHGLRSLSTTDAFYRRNNAPGDAPYWRCALLLFL
jgi:mannosyl-oligosaccharide glucosidase